MDYKEVRKRNKIKKKGGTTRGREITTPKRIDYVLRRRVVLLCVMMIVSFVLGAVVLLSEL